MNISVNGADVTIISIVKGLVSEISKIEEIASFDGAVGICLGQEEIDALLLADTEEWEYDPSDLEAVYSHRLKEYGEVSIPVPAFYKAVQLRKDIIPLDMNDFEYTDKYCECVGVLEILKEKKIAKKAMNAVFESNTAEEFAIEWDEMVNKIKGHRLLSCIREEFIANSIFALTENNKKIIAILEIERIPGIIKVLESKNANI